MVNNVLSSICYAGGTLLLCHFEPSRNDFRDTNSVPHSLVRTPVARHKPLVTSHCLENSAPICRLSATNCKPAFLSPAFTTTSIDIVGAPTFPFLHAPLLKHPRPCHSEPRSLFERGEESAFPWSLAGSRSLAPLGMTINSRDSYGLLFPRELPNAAGNALYS